MPDKAAVLSRLALSVARGDAAEPLALRLCRACVEILDATGGAITLAPTRPERLTLCATDGIAARIEDLQEVLGEGPCQEAFLTGRGRPTTPSAW